MASRLTTDFQMGDVVIVRGLTGQADPHQQLTITGITIGGNLTFTIDDDRGLCPLSDAILMVEQGIWEFAKKGGD